MVLAFHAGTGLSPDYSTKSSFWVKKKIIIITEREETEAALSSTGLFPKWPTMGSIGPEIRILGPSSTDFASILAGN